MNRKDFLYALRRGLEGLPKAQAADVIADYESHFDEGLADGRSEEEIAAALGDPTRLARELRAEAGFKRWESDRSPGSFAGVVLALLGLATVDIMLLLPLIFPAFLLFVMFGALSLGLFVAGIVLSLVALFPGLAWFALTGGAATLVAVGLTGLGLIAGGVGLAALFWAALNAVARLLVRYARLHFRLIDAVSV
jgi:uncharacterized membrane protein